MEWTGALSSGTRRQIADALIDLQASSYNGESKSSVTGGSGKKQANRQASNSPSNSYLNLQEQDVRGLDGRTQMVTKFINLDSFEHMAPPV